MDEEHAAFGWRYVEEAGYADRITIHVGPALETIEGLEGDFDFIFIDADKVNYVSYYEAPPPPFGTRSMAIDNTLWSGRVLAPDDTETTRAIAEFNDHLAADSRVVAVVLTVRDGITLVRRAGE